MIKCAFDTNENNEFICNLPLDTDWDFYTKTLTENNYPENDFTCFLNRQKSITKQNTIFNIIQIPKGISFYKAGIANESLYKDIRWYTNNSIAVKYKDIERIDILKYKTSKPLDMINILNENNLKIIYTLIDRTYKRHFNAAFGLNIPYNEQLRLLSGFRNFNPENFTNQVHQGARNFRRYSYKVIDEELFPHIAQILSIFGIDGYIAEKTSVYEEIGVFFPKDKVKYIDRLDMTGGKKPKNPFTSISKKSKKHKKGGNKNNDKVGLPIPWTGKYENMEDYIKEAEKGDKQALELTRKYHPDVYKKDIKVTDEEIKEQHIKMWKKYQKLLKNGDI